jgi:hypothetical protein
MPNPISSRATGVKCMLKSDVS